VVSRGLCFAINQSLALNQNRKEKKSENNHGDAAHLQQQVAPPGDPVPRAVYDARGAPGQGERGGGEVELEGERIDRATSLFEKEREKTLSLFLRSPPPPPTITSFPPTPLQVVGELDTVTGGLEFSARVEKIVGPPIPDANAPWRLKRASLARPRAAAGVSYCSRRDALLARVSAGGSHQLGDEVWVGAKAVLELDTRTQATTAAGRISLSKNLFDFSPWQQLRLAAGVDLSADARGRVTRVPFLAVRENNWSAVVDDRGRLAVRYDL